MTSEQAFDIAKAVTVQVIAVQAPLFRDNEGKINYSNLSNDAADVFYNMFRKLKNTKLD